MEYRLTDFLPTTKKELELRGWDELDVILFSGDAYVDHPSFGAAVIGRTLEAAGYRVAIVPQPDWHGDFRDFRKLGRPRLFFGISPGCMDSMVNKYTANRRLRSEDAYSPDGRHDMRPEYPTIVYSNILRQLYPDVPSRTEVIEDMPQIVYLTKQVETREDDIVLHSHEECLRDKRAEAENYRHIEEQSNMMHARRLLQHTGSDCVVVNPPYPPMTTEEIDASFDLPYTRQPHPKYKGKRIPAYDMIKHSVNIHRGCFGGCAFCTISAHQGKFIACRSKQSILKEVKQVTQMPDFKGYLSDLGGPSANMYGMHGRNLKACEKCKRPSCIHPQICPNLNTSHQQLLDIYRAVDALPGIKKSFIGSGVRYDLRTHLPACQRPTEGGSRAYQRPRADAHAQALVQAVWCLQAHLRPHQSRGEPAPADHTLLHLQPPGLPRGGHGRIGSTHQGHGLPTGTGAGLHTDAHDHRHRDLVHGLRPLHARASILGQDTTRETRSAPVLLLVQAGGTARHRAEPAAHRPHRPDQQTIPQWKS